MSRARSTSDHLYLIRVAGTSSVKVGISSNPSRRLATLQTANPGVLELLYVIGPLARAKAYERRMHKQMKADGRHIHGEWFTIHPWELEQVLEDAGIKVK